MGSSVGGAVAIDFGDPANPAVRPISYDFTRSGHALCIVDTGSDHSARHLTEDYSDITREMRSVAVHFGKQLLREVPEADFRSAIPALRRECGDRAVLRALHFYDDDRRAVQEADALEQGNFAEGTGAIRVHGGGFAGTIQAFVPLEKLDAFRSGMEALLGPGMCHVLRVRPQGGCVVVS